MSQKRAHRLRSLQGTQRERDYAKAMVAWLERKPSAIHFIRRIILKRREPRRIDF